MTTSSSFADDLLDMLARQWSSIGLAIDSPGGVPYVVDPEALITATEDLADLDARVAEVSRDWTSRYARYINEARLRRMRRVRPAGPPRDDRFASTTGAGPRGRVRDIDFGAPATLLLRLRGLAGVNARAEILLRLAASRSPQTVAELADTCAYSKQNVAEAVGLLVDARVCRAERSGNRRVVELAPSEAPPWLRPDGRCPSAPVWPAILPILIQVARHVDGSAPPRSSGRVSELLARQELMTSSSSTLSKAGWPSAKLAHGAGIDDAYQDWLAELVGAMTA
jgi:hypothetical protein